MMDLITVGHRFLLESHIQGCVEQASSPAVDFSGFHVIALCILLEAQMQWLLHISSARSKMGLGVRGGRSGGLTLWKEAFLAPRK